MDPPGQAKASFGNSPHRTPSLPGRERKSSHSHRTGPGSLRALLEEGPARDIGGRKSRPETPFRRLRPLFPIALGSVSLLAIYFGLLGFSPNAGIFENAGPNEFVLLLMSWMPLFGVLPLRKAADPEPTGRQDKIQKGHHEALNHIIRTIGSELEQKELFRRIVKGIRSAIPCERCLIASLDTEKKSIRYWHLVSDVSVEPRILNENEFQIMSDEFRDVYGNHRIANLPDLRKVPTPRARQMAEAGFRSQLRVPILVKGECIAHMSLASTRRSAFTKKHEKFMGDVANHLSSVIQNAHLFQMAHQRAARLEIVDRIAKAVSSTMEPKELFETLVREIRKAVPCERCLIAYIDPQTKRHKYWHVESDIEIEMREDPFDEGGVWWDREVYEKNRPVNIPNIEKIPFPHAKTLLVAGFRSALRIPILQEGKCIAHLSLSSTRTAAFTQDDVDLLVSIAAHLGSAIRNATLFQMGEERASRLAVLNEIAKTVSSTLSPAELFHVIVREIRNAVPCERYVISTLNLETNEYHYWHVESDVKVEPISVPILEHRQVCKEVYESKKLRNIPDLFETPSRHKNRLARAGLRNILLIPIVQDNRCIAHLTLSSLKVSAFSSKDEELLTSLSAHLGAAIKNATLYQEAETRNKRLTVQNAIAEAVGSTMKPDELFRMIAQEIRKAVPCDRFIIASWNPASQRHTYWHIGSDIELEPMREENEGEWEGQEVYRTKRPQYIPLLREGRSSIRKRILKAGLKCVLVVPIFQDDLPIAHMSLSSLKEGAFSAEQIDLLASVSGHLGTAIRNATLYQAAEERSSRLAVLNELNRKISGNLNLSEVLDSIADAAFELLEADYSRIYLLDESTAELVPNSTRSSVGDQNIASKRYGMGESVIGRVVQTGQPVIHPDIHKVPAWKPNGPHSRKNFHSYIAQPLRQGEKIIGAIKCMSRKTGFFSEEDLDLLGALASQASVALANAGLFQAAEVREHRLSALVAVAQRLTRGLEVSKVLDSIADAAAAVFEGEAAFRVLEGDFLVRTAETSGTRGDMVKSRIRVGESLSGLAAARRKIMVTEDAANDPRILPEHRRAVDPNRTGSQMSVPLKLESRILGILNIYRERGFHFDQNAHELAQSLADQAAIAIENARLFQESEEKQKRLATLVAVAQRLTRGLELNEILDAIAEAAAMVFGGEAGFRLLEGEFLVRAGGTSIALRQMVKDRIRLGESISGIAAATGEIQISEDMARDFRLLPEHRAAVVENRTGSLISVPMKVESRVLGTLNIHRERGFRFDENALKLAASLADQAAIAIENARLHEEERRARDFLKSVVGESGDAIFVVETDRKIILWNKSAERIYGYTEEEALGRHIDLIITEKEKRKAKQIIEEIMRTGKPVAFDSVRIRKDGNLVPVSVTISPVFSKDGQIVAITGINKDLTERKKAEEALRESEERFRKIFEESSIGMAFVNLDQQIVKANTSLCKMLGYSESELRRLPMSDIIHPEYIESERRYGRLLLENDIQVHKTEIRYLKKDSGVLWANLTASVFRDENGKPVHFLSMIEDITERKQVEENLRHKEKLNAIGQLASGVAHDFNNTLAVILGRAQILRGKTENEHIEQGLETIMLAAKGGAQTIKRLQDFARKRKGYHAGRVDLNEVLAEVADMTRPRWKNDAESVGISIDLEIRSNAKDATILGEASELHEALINLINNSLDAMREGGRIILSTENHPEGVKVSVSDTGKGMRPEERERALEPFFTTKGERGTGLGLSMVYGIVERHNGNIRIKSRKGKGTTVSLIFPRARQKMNEADPSENQPSPPRRILVVDDEAEVAKTLGEMLEEEGHEVEIFTRPKEALARLPEARFDLVMTDLGMPEVSGWEIGKAVKKLDRQTPVILVTGWGNYDLEPQNLRRNGIDRVIEKPFDKNDVLSAVTEAGVQPKKA